MVTLQFIFGYGVGGEYPLASSSAVSAPPPALDMLQRTGHSHACTCSDCPLALKMLRCQGIAMLHFQ